MLVFAREGPSLSKKEILGMWPIPRHIARRTDLSNEEKEILGGMENIWGIRGMRRLKSLEPTFIVTAMRLCLYFASLPILVLVLCVEKLLRLFKFKSGTFPVSIVVLVALFFALPHPYNWVSLKISIFCIITAGLWVYLVTVIDALKKY